MSNLEERSKRMAWGIFSRVFEPLRSRMMFDGIEYTIVEKLSPVLETYLREVERESMVAGRIAGLEEAAAILCSGCRNGAAIEFDDVYGWFWHSYPSSEISVDCHAYAIRARIEALKEGEK